MQILHNDNRDDDHDGDQDDNGVDYVDYKGGDNSDDDRKD
jgi:hypothetical protein